MSSKKSNKSLDSGATSSPYEIIRTVSGAMGKVGLRPSNLKSNGECKEFIKRFRRYYRSKRTSEIIDKKLASELENLSRDK